LPKAEAEAWEKYACLVKETGIRSGFRSKVVLLQQINLAYAKHAGIWWPRLPVGRWKGVFWPDLSFHRANFGSHEQIQKVRAIGPVTSKWRKI